MSETPLAQAVADVMLYNDTRKAWQPPDGTDGKSHVQILQHNVNNCFRIVAVSTQDGFCVLNYNIHHRLKYHTATPTFHQWRDEQRQVYGLSFASEAEAEAFVMVMTRAIDILNSQNAHGHSEYHSIQHDNVYQDPHQHLQHIQSAPNFRDTDNSIHPSFRKTSHALQGSQLVAQQQRRSSQGSNSSPNGSINGHSHSQSSMATASPSRVPPAPPAPPSGGPPPAPPPPPVGIASVNAPPAPPPPPPNLMSSKPAGGPSLADQLKNASLRKTNGIKENRSTPNSENGTASAAPAPPPPPSTSNGGAHGCLLSELAATINKRKINQAKADAADSKSNISNGSSDSGCGGIQPPSNGVKKWESVKTNGHSDSPKTHRKVPSGSSISSQEEVAVKSSGPVTAEFLERFKADLMVEVRLEINKAKQDIIEALKMELAKK